MDILTIVIAIVVVAMLFHAGVVSRGHLDIAQVLRRIDAAIGRMDRSIEKNGPLA